MTLHQRELRADPDVARRRTLEPRNEPKRRRLAATRRADQDEEAAGGRGDGDVTDRARETPDLADTNNRISDIETASKVARRVR
jgi:hypothetical protein